MTAPAQARLNLLEWIDAGEALLRNVGQFGPAYDRAKVERFQKAVNASARSIVDDQEIRPVRVDGFWGPEVVGALKVLLSHAPNDPFPSVYPNVYRYQQWNAAGTQAALAEHFAGRRALLALVFELESPQASSVPDATTAASSEAQAAVAAATDPLTAPPAPEAPPVQPPPDEAAPGPRPPSPREPLPSAPPGSGRLARRATVQSTGAVPWLGIGIGVTAAAALLWFLASKRKAK